MANPPITIGSFDNVPAAGSPIRSDWAQEITHFVNDRPAHTMGASGAVSLDAFGNFSVNFTRAYAGPPGVSAQVILADGTANQQTYVVVVTNVTVNLFTVNVFQSTNRLVSTTVGLSWLVVGILAG